MGININTGKKVRVYINRYKLPIETPTIFGANTLIQLKDVDASDADNNETLVYDEDTGKYIVKTLPIINGGTF